MRLLIVSLAVLFALTASASSVEPLRAGGDEPAVDSWPKTVETFANSLGESDPGALVPVLSDDVSIATFDSKSGDAVRLLARTRKGTLISHFHYVYAPENMAGDVAEAFKAAEVPEELKKKMAMRDETHARRANRTAASWLAEAIGAKPGDKVGVVVFWCENNGYAESQFSKIKAICYGDPIARPGK